MGIETAIFCLVIFVTTCVVHAREFGRLGDATLCRTKKGYTTYITNIVAVSVVAIVACGIAGFAIAWLFTLLP